MPPQPSVQRSRLLKPRKFLIPKQESENAVQSFESRQFTPGSQNEIDMSDESIKVESLTSSPQVGSDHSSVRDNMKIITSTIFQPTAVSPANESSVQSEDSDMSARLGRHVIEYSGINQPYLQSDRNEGSATSKSNTWTVLC